MIAPPRTTERVLASLGAEARFRDAVIGDLAEEFAHRAARDRLVAAERWYRREAIRAMPHLAQNALRRLGARGVLHKIGIAMTAYTMALMATLTAAAIVASIARELGAPAGPLHVPPAMTWLAILVAFGILTLDMAMATFGGYLAAYLDDDAPLLSAGILGVLWVSVSLAGGAIVRAIVGPPAALPQQPHVWLQTAAMVTVVGGSVAGGMLRVRTRQPAHEGFSLGPSARDEGR